MKALTLWQPYADLIILGLKHVETRSYPTNIRGRVAIHAAQYHRLQHEVYEKIAAAQGIKQYDGSFLHYLENGIGNFGALLGTVEIIGCLRIVNYDDLNECAYLDNGSKYQVIESPEYFLGDYRPGRFAWVLKNPIRFPTPIPAKGHQGWWNWEERDAP